MKSKLFLALALVLSVGWISVGAVSVPQQSAACPWVINDSPDPYCDDDDCE